MKHRTAVIAGKRIETSWIETETTIEATVDGRSYRLEKLRVREGILWLCSEGSYIDAFVTPRENGYEVLIRGKRTSVSSHAYTQMIQEPFSSQMIPAEPTNKGAESKGMLEIAPTQLCCQPGTKCSTG